jgi:hypothetical protein
MPWKHAETVRMMPELAAVLACCLLSAGNIPARAQSGVSLPDAPAPASRQDAGSSRRLALANDLKSFPKHFVADEVRVVTSPGRVHGADVVWLLPLAGATAASLATDSYTMRNVVSHDAALNNDAGTSSDILRDSTIGLPILMYGLGTIRRDDHSREAGLLAGEAMLDSFVLDEGIKYVFLRERPFQNNARGHFFTGDAVSDPSFVSGHSIVAWSSAAVLAGEYSRPWQQIGIYTLASSVSVTRVLSQQHFPTDALLGSTAGWLIGRYVYRAHHRQR